VNAPASAETLDPALLAEPAPEVRRRWLTIGGPAVWILASVALLATKGLFLSRDVVALWVLSGLLAFSLADLRGNFRRIVFDWLPFFAILFAYDLLRGLVGDTAFSVNYMPQVDVDEFLFMGALPTVWLQERLWDSGNPGLLDYSTWAIYLTHFFATFLIAAILWKRAHERFIHFRNLILGVTAAAFVTYVLFPAAPPWLASDDGLIGGVERVVAGVWADTGFSPAEAIWQRGSSYANEVAAIPSLHTAIPVMIMLFFWSSGRTARILGLGYALAMGFTLVYTGEHYVIDVVLGWVYSGAVFGVYGWWQRRREGSARAGDGPGAI